MILKYIAIQLSDHKLIKYNVVTKNRELWEQESTYGSDFSYKTRSLCNYLEREVLTPLKYKTNDFKIIVIILGEVEDYDKEVFRDIIHEDQIYKKAYVNTSNALSTDVIIDRQEYNRLKTKQEINDYFIEQLTRGLEETNKHVDIPLYELLQGMQKFKEGGYENKWTFKTRQFRDLGIKCRLNCNLTLENFHLNLQIEQKGKKVIFDKEILKTKPDELIFLHQFKDVVVQGDQIQVVKNRTKDNLLFKVNLAELGL